MCARVFGCVCAAGQQWSVCACVCQHSSLLDQFYCFQAETPSTTDSYGVARFSASQQNKQAHINTLTHIQLDQAHNTHAHTHYKINCKACDPNWSRHTVTSGFTTYSPPPHTHTLLWETYGMSGICLAVDNLVEFLSHLSVCVSLCESGALLLLLGMWLYLFISIHIKCTIGQYG